MADGSIRRIETIKTGEVLLGFDETKLKPAPTVVKQTMNRKVQSYISFKLPDDKMFRVTREHPIYTKSGWKQAKDLVKGEEVLLHDSFYAAASARVSIELIHSVQTRNYSKHQLYPVWKQMISRCHMYSSHNFKYYGARGIQVCLEWRYSPEGFFTWAEQNGWETGLELDRIDNSGDYAPNNCRFVSHAENSENRRIKSTNTSGFIGVASLNNGKFRYGTSIFTNAGEAAIAREEDILQSGRNLALNFPHVLNATVRWEPITYIRYQVSDTTVFNFECEPHNNYFQQGPRHPTSAFQLNYGVLAHNCFSHSQKDINPGTKSAPLQGVHADKLFATIDGKNTTKEGKLFHKYFYKDKFLLHWGGLADSFCHYETKYGMSYPILEGLLDRKYPLMFSSKGPAIVEDRYVKLFEKYAKQNTIAFQFSIVTADDKLAKHVEPGVPSPTKRFEYMKILSDMGYWCILRLRPYIIGVTDLTITDLLEKAYQSGAKAVSTEFYALDQRCVGSMKKATIEMGALMGVKDIFAYFQKLSPKERGGYCRLNRLVKELHVKYMYTFCQKHNMLFTCSDPDFKELSQSGNCCGLPENHPTPSMNNWSKAQMTFFVKEARKYYHTTGKLMDFSFENVYNRKNWIFDEIQLSHQDIGCTSYPYAMRKQLTLRHILQSKWNNLHSYANPSSYFHGKVLPVGLDEEGANLLYRYNPSEYEARWVEEGIDLTK